MNKPIVPPLLTSNLDKDLQRSMSSPRMGARFSPTIGVQTPTSADRRKSIVGNLFNGLQLSALLSPRSPKRRGDTSSPSSPRSNRTSPATTPRSMPNTPKRHASGLNFSPNKVLTPLESPRYSRACHATEVFDFAVENNRFVVVIILRGTFAFCH